MALHPLRGGQRDERGRAGSGARGAGLLAADVEIRPGEELPSYLYGSTLPAAAARASLREMLMAQGEECWIHADAAQKAGMIVGVYAPDSGRVQAAREVLAAHGAASISYYRPRDVVNLSLHPGA